MADKLLKQLPNTTTVTTSPGYLDILMLGKYQSGGNTTDPSQNVYIAENMFLRDFLSSLVSTVRSYLAGLTLSAAGATGTFGIAAGIAADSTNAATMALASAYTKTTSAWAVGSGNGGIDTGTIANTTWYHVYLIERTDTGVVDVLFSLSATSPTLPSSYTLFRRIGSMLTDGSAHWVKFEQNGDEFLWDAQTSDINVSLSDGLAHLYPMSVPTGIKVNVLFSLRASFSSVTSFFIITSPDQADTAPNSGSSPPLWEFFAGTALANPVLSYNIRTDTSGNVRIRGNNGSGTGASDSSLHSMTRGWIDTRGRNG